MIVNISLEDPDEEILQKAVEILKKGGLIVYPTETAYGLGCDAFNTNAIRNLYEIKERLLNQPCSVIVSSIKMIEEISEINNSAMKLFETFYPGPLVIALKKKQCIPDLLNKNGIAFRISKNQIAQKLTQLLNRPIVSTSANLSGDKTPYSIEDVINSIEEEKIDLILDSGPLSGELTSTIVDFTLNPPPQIIREGSISGEEILQVLGIAKEKWKYHYYKKQ